MHTVEANASGEADLGQSIHIGGGSFRKKLRETSKLSCLVRFYRVGNSVAGRFVKKLLNLVQKIAQFRPKHRPKWSLTKLRIKFGNLRTISSQK
jgi:hypothetical protein